MPGYLSDSVFSYVCRACIEDPSGVIRVLDEGFIKGLSWPRFATTLDLSPKHHSRNGARGPGSRMDGTVYGPVGHEGCKDLLFGLGLTQRPHSSFLGFIYRIPQGNPKKERLWGLWVSLAPKP